MNIANNILKHSLQNVYFLRGTALAGKTTMSKALVKNMVSFGLTKIIMVRLSKCGNQSAMKNISR